MASHLFGCDDDMAGLGRLLTAQLPCAVGQMDTYTAARLRLPNNPRDLTACAARIVVKQVTRPSNRPDKELSVN